MPIHNPNNPRDMFGVPLTESQVTYLSALKERLAQTPLESRVGALEEALALQAFTMSNMRGVMEDLVTENRIMRAQLNALLQRPVDAKIPTINPFIKPFPEG